MPKRIILFPIAAAMVALLSQAALAAESTSGGTAGGPAYVHLAPINVSVIGTTNKIDREVDVQLNLELEDGKTSDMFEKYRRNTQDAFLMTLKGLYDDDYAGSQVPMDVIKDSLLTSVNTITGPGFVHSVLIVALGERRAR